MPSTESREHTGQVALFDLDGTLTWNDTLLPYLAGYARRHPSSWLRLWRLPWAVADYGFGTRDRGLLKSRIIRMVMGGASRSCIEAWTARFVGGLQRRGTFRPAALEVLAAHRAAGDRLVLLSASPDLYVPHIGRLLGMERTVCTEIQWRHSPGREDILDGALKTPNRRGEEKCACLAWIRSQYPGLPVTAYGNSASDLPHLELAERALLVNAAARAVRAAGGKGIDVALWE